MAKRSDKRRESWFVVGKPLSRGRGAALMVCSFLLPLGIWSFFAYSAFLWDTDYRVTVTANPEDKEKIPATYSPGDKLQEDFFRDFQELIRSENAALLEARSEGVESTETPRSIRSANKKVLRAFEPVMLENGWYVEEVDPDSGTKDYNKLYAAVFESWRGIASGRLRPEPGTLSEENIGIVKDNWERIASVSPTYDATDFISEPLLKLVPQGDPQVGRPPYLPAPHEVLSRAILDFSGNSPLGDLKIGERYLSSLGVVFSGFLLAMVIGVPLALLAGTFGFFSRLTEPFVDFFRYMPAPAFSTVLMAVFGLSQAPKIALVLVGTLPQMILMVANTTRLLDQSLLEAAQTLGARRGQLFKRVVIPGILPSLYNDLRILLGWAWTWLVIAELIGEKSGLTAIIDTQGRRFHFETVYPIILLIGVTGFFTDQILAALRTVFFPWESAGKPSFAMRLTQVVTWLPRKAVVLVSGGKSRNPAVVGPTEPGSPDP